MGHCLGISGHTSDGGLMDTHGGNLKISSSVRRGVELLYSLPPGTNITSRMRWRKYSQMPYETSNGKDSLYDPSGSRLIHGPIISARPRH